MNNMHRRLAALLSLLPLVSAAPGKEPHKQDISFFPRKHLRRQQAQSCPSVFPIPRSSPGDSEAGYPIQITMNAQDPNNSPDSSGQDTDSSGEDSDRDSSNHNSQQNTSTAATSTPNKTVQRQPSPRIHYRADQQPSPLPVELAFTLPSQSSSSSSSSSSSGPCTLMLDLTSSDAKVNGAATINVYALDGPSAGSLVGTTHFAQGQKTTVNSFACRQDPMCFRFEVADDGGTGNGVSFLQGGTEGMGLNMQYGC